MTLSRRATGRAGLAASCLLVYTLLSYGGIRSPDSEIVFRTSEALVTRGSFAVDHELETWNGFGLATGRDGRRYSIFGPGQSIVAAPLVAAGRSLAATGLFRNGAIAPPISHYLGDGVEEFVANRPPKDRDGSGVRWFATLLNILVTTASVLLFHRIAGRIAGDDAAALLAAVIYGFGTLACPYAGTFFSEPLASLCVLAAFDILFAHELSPALPGATRRMAWAGLWLGAAVATHVTAVLFVPFFFCYALRPTFSPADPGKSIPPALGFLAGLFLLLVPLGAYNFLRFGDALETGRGVDPLAAARFGYGSFTNPIPGLYGLLISPNKGLLLVCPAVVLAGWAWGQFQRDHRFLSIMLALATASRIGFIAGRTDWHGGFSLGPRYLVMLVPFLCLPLALLARDVLRGGFRPRLLFGAAAWLCLCQQYYFTLGEVFSRYRVLDWQALRLGRDIITGDRIFLELALGPLTGLLDGRRGPALLRSLPLGNDALFALGCALIGGGLFVLLTRLKPAPVPWSTSSSD